MRSCAASCTILSSTVGNHDRKGQGLLSASSALPSSPRSLAALADECHPRLAGITANDSDFTIREKLQTGIRCSLPLTFDDEQEGDGGMSEWVYNPADSLCALDDLLADC